eukprot:gnl/MRDRNA2_/MRDRNA2_155186_c0_seq1.p1 gnl/MRDRNA2_/MRDRNA2_155186_c0~~gnl/MRDRNA2_/MRDRNA2_155186_c0_seq1.p1  ORF type:complete len:929 (+),score=101.84 gnl/MRDRNA2_/MRDRNA2_155186_c0_seq1:38-2824(+)
MHPPYWQLHLVWLTATPLHAAGKAAEKQAVSCHEAMQFDMSEVAPTICPSECPFLAPTVKDKCNVNCVTAGECGESNGQLSFANPASGYCEKCKVAACRKCGLSPTYCTTCMKGFYSDDGNCISQAATKWVIVYAILAIIAILVFSYLLSLYVRPVVNQAVLDSGLYYRECAKLTDLHEQGLYPLSTNVHTEYLAGAGIILHFNWQLFIIMWCILMCVGLSQDSPALRSAFGKHVFSRQTCHASEEEQTKAEESFHEIDMNLLLFAFIAYFGTSLSCLVFAIYQNFLFKHIDERSTMAHYALHVHGFPVEKGNPRIEQEYKEFIELATGLDVVGVSVCWNFTSMADKIYIQLDHELERLEMSPSSRRNLDILSGRMLPVSSPRDLRYNKAGFGHCLRCIDNLYLPTLLPEDRDFIPPEDVKSLLSDMYVSGDAFVIFRSESDRNHAKKILKALKKDDMTASFFRGEPVRLSVQHAQHEPESVRWANFGPSASTFWHNIARCFIALVFIIIAWACVFYGPYAYYLLFYSQVPGETQGSFFEQTLLGLLISCGNQVVYFVLGVLADRAGFHFKETHDRFYVIMYTFAIFVNTIIDLWTVVILSHSVELDEGVVMNPQDFAVTDPNRLAHDPQVQENLVLQLLGYLYPGTLLLPYLVEPVMLNIVPYYLFKWLVRSRRSIDLRSAEQLLACIDFDLCRYGDIIVQVSVCICVLFLTSPELWRTFAYLLVSLLLIYVWDRYRLLRATSRTFFGSDVLDKTATDLFALPCSLLAMCAAFRCYKAGVGGLDRSSVYQVCFGAAALHLLAHVIIKHILTYCSDKVAKRCQDKDEAELQELCFEEVAEVSACSWFTSNPIHCLRSKYIHGHDPPCIFYKQGKEYLLERNPEAHCFYQFDGIPMMAVMEDFATDDSGTYVPTGSAASDTSSMSSVAA